MTHHFLNSMAVLFVAGACFYFSLLPYMTRPRR
jgi:hypothetical protein